MRTIFFLLISVAPLFGASWYVEQAATGTSANNGTSWANAWTNCTQIGWASINAGDTLWIGGGPSGTTNLYVGVNGSLSHYGKSYNSGTAANPILVRFDGTNTAHNGLAVLDDLLFYGDFWHIDGSRDGVWGTNWAPANLLQNYFVPTNCGIWFHSDTTNQTACKFDNEGGEIKWVVIHDYITQTYDQPQTYQIYLNQKGTGTNSISYCYISNCFSYFLYAVGRSSGNQGFGKLDIHGCCFLNGQDNLSQYMDCLDFHDNIVISNTKYQRDSDGFQTYFRYCRIWNNIFSGMTTRWFNTFDSETNATQLIGDCVVANNVFYGDYAHHFSGNPGLPPPNQDADWDQVMGLTFWPTVGTNLMLTNIWVCNNVFHDEYGGGIFFWSSVTATGPLTRAPYADASDIYWYNNVVVAPTNYNAEMFRFQYFDDPVFDSGYGFHFTTNRIGFDYNTIFSHSPNLQSYKVKYSTNYYLITAMPPSWGFGAGNSTNIINYENDVVVTNPSYLYRPLWSGAPAGTNLNGTYATTVAPWITNDMLGRPRGANWDQGPYQRDPSLLLWVTFNNWDGVSTNIADDSGNNIGITNTVHTYGLWVTNVPTLTNGPNYTYGNAAHFWGNGYSGGANSYVGQWMAVKPVSSALMDLTNATVAVWASPERVSQATYGNYGTLLDAYCNGNYAGMANSWHLGRHSSYFMRLMVIGPYDTDADTNRFSFLYWPDSDNFGNMVTNWHHYAFTFDGTNIAGYYDGTNFATTNVTGIVNKLHLFTRDDCLNIGAWQHEGTTEQDADDSPNTGWWNGGMDDIRIYNRALSAAEIAGLYSSTLITGGSGTNPPLVVLTNTIIGNGTMTGNGTLQ